MYVSSAIIAVASTVTWRRMQEDKLGLRWRTEAEVVSGKGQFSCGARGCAEARGLATFEVPFGYTEAGARKEALVKVLPPSQPGIADKSAFMGPPCMQAPLRLGSPDAEHGVPQLGASASTLSRPACARYGASDVSAVRSEMLCRCECALSMRCS